MRAVIVTSVHICFYRAACDLSYYFNLKKFVGANIKKEFLSGLQILRSRMHLEVLCSSFHAVRVIMLLFHCLKSEIYPDI